MKIRKYQLFLHFISRWQSILFLMTVLVFALTFVLAGIMTGRFEISQLDANISVQRAFGQVIFYLPIVGMMTFLLVSQAQNTSLLIRIRFQKLDSKIYFAGVILFGSCDIGGGLDGLDNCGAVLIARSRRDDVSCG